MSSCQYGQRPAAVGEPAVGVFVLAAGGLDDAVEGDELVNDELSHGDLLGFLEDPLGPP